MTNKQFANKVAEKIYSSFDFKTQCFSMADWDSDYETYADIPKNKVITTIENIILQEIDNYKKDKGKK